MMETTELSPELRTAENLIRLEEMKPYFRKDELGKKHWRKYRCQFAKMFPRNSRIIDMGSSRGEDSCYFRKQGLKVVSADIEFDRLKKASKKGEKVVMDIRELGIQKGSMDGIWVGNVLIFAAEESEEVLKQCLDTLKPGGVLFLCSHFLPSSTADLCYTEEELLEDAHNSFVVRQIIDKLGFEVLQEDIGIDIPEKRHFADEFGFQAIFAQKPEGKSEYINFQL